MKSGPQPDRALGLPAGNVARRAWRAHGARSRQAAEDRNQLAHEQAGSVLGPRAPAGETMVTYRADTFMLSQSQLRDMRYEPHRGIRAIWPGVSSAASGERKIKIAKIKQAMTKIRIDAAVSSCEFDPPVWSLETFDVVFG